jgi:predicted esterase
VKYLALNGFRHPLNRYFNNKVECVNKFNWTYSNAVEYAISNIKEPTVVIGFSDGATAALTMARHSPLVKSVYAHSPMFREESRKLKCRVHLFRTGGDTTPTYHDTWNVYEHLKVSNYPVNVTLQTLFPGPHEPIRDLATFTMWLKNHQFRNCLPHLPQEIVR